MAIPGLPLSVAIVVAAWCVSVLVASESQFAEYKSNARTGLADMQRVQRRSAVPPAVGVAAHHRTKRTLFDQTWKEKIVDKHNSLRRTVGASDMIIMNWNDYLADMAEDWANGCDWDHGQPPRDPATMPYNPLGQNLYVTTAPMDPVIGIQLWFDEISFYNYETGGCQAGEACGHYTQVAWANSKEIGCAWAYCPTMVNLNFNNANYLVCNYGPAGNYQGVKPFIKGSPCTTCKSGNFWCEDGLCQADCTSQSTKCDCKADCKNCGQTVPGSCSCACEDGWTGVDCSAPCEDTHASCGASPGWPTTWCDAAHQYVLDQCPALCQLCQELQGIPKESWDAWSECSLPCGGCGVQRRRGCINSLNWEHRACNICPCIRNTHPSMICEKNPKKAGTIRVRSTQCCYNFHWLTLVQLKRISKPCYFPRVHGWVPLGTDTSDACLVVGPSVDGYGPPNFIKRIRLP